MSRYHFDFEEPLKAIEEKISSLHKTASRTGIDVYNSIKKLQSELENKKDEIYSNLSRWQRVQLARHPMRPHSSDYITRIVDGWYEFHGDRLYSDDSSVITGSGFIEGRKFIIICQEKGRGTNDKVARNFGMMRPEGYRKAQRIMKLAEKFNIPVLSLIDTPGAYPGIGAEERGQAEAIASNLLVMSRLNVPIISVVIGEGASGGALGICLSDKMLCLENTWFSVISPEGCASILFRDSTKCIEAADSMKVTSKDLFELGMCDQIIHEPSGGAHVDYDAVAESVKNAICREYDLIISKSSEDLIEERIKKYSNMGSWIDNG